MPAAVVSYLTHYLFARAIWIELRRGVAAGSLGVYAIAAGCVILVAWGWRHRSHRSYYRWVLKSRRWRKLRRLAYERSHGRCVRCGRRKSLGVLQLHHKTYKKLGKERLSEVELLCDDCHRVQHHLAA
jgi:5-methylcytosine-specific restriction endonuclease McrA